MDSSAIPIWTGLFPNRGCLASFYDKYALYKFLGVMRSAASDLGFHSLSLSLLKTHFGLHNTLMTKRRLR